MDKKKILTMSLAVGLGTLTAFSVNNISATADEAVVQKLGDVNNDGMIDAVDSTNILIEYTYLSTSGNGTFSDAQKESADTNKDGFIDSVDASCVLEYYAYTSTGGMLTMEEWKEETPNTSTDITTTVTTTTTGTTTTTNTDNTSSSPTQTTTVTSVSETTATTTTVTVHKISEIKLTKYNMILSVGEKDISYVTMLPDSVSNKDEIWTSSDEKIATVDSWGNVTGVSAGTCTVTVASVDNPSVKADIKVTVNAPDKISEIKLTKYNMNISVGGRDISYVTMLPEDISDKDEIWTSSDEKIATVDSWGNVTGVSAGTCTVTVASVNNPNVKADIKVTVSDPNRISEIRLSKTEITINVGKMDISYVTMLPESVANKDEIWTSSDEKIATVDKWGNIIGISAGTCTVTVASVDNPSVKADIKVTVTDNSSTTTTTTTTTETTTTTTATETTTTTTTSATTTTSVSPKISEIRLTKYDINISVGGKDISYVTMLPESVANKDEIWTSSDEKIATVDKWGNITGVSAGTCTVTVTSVDNPEVKADIKVIVTDNSSTTTTTSTTATTTTNTTTTTTNTATTETTTTTTTTTTATTETSATTTSATTTISVSPQISEIRLTKYEMNVAVGKTDISYVTMFPDGISNKNEIWTSSDEKIAKVDNWGNIIGISAGTCTVTVTSVDNPEVKADIKVTVTDKSHNFQQINGLTYIDGILIANKSYSLPSTYDPGMDATTVKQFGELSSAAAKEGLNIYLSSGYRSYTYQSGIYNNYVSYYGKAIADTFSARAGHSEHQTGFAIDVNTIDDSFAGTPEAVWLENHAHEYGFIVRYPKGKENITGYKYEPWHIRYLGVKNATDVYNSGLTLEEYLGIDSYYH